MIYEKILQSTTSKNQSNNQPYFCSSNDQVSTRSDYLKGTKKATAGAKFAKHAAWMSDSEHIWPDGGGQFPHSVVMVKMHENIASSIRLATFEFHSTYLITGSWWIVLIVHSIIFASASSFGVTANTVTPHFSAREDGRWGVLHAMIAQHAQIDFPQYVLQANPVC